jgi:hypothetical protein
VCDALKARCSLSERLTGQASPTASTDRLDDDLDDDRIHLDEHDDNPGGSTDEDEEDDDGFGDDFDEFAEGQEADADNDFGDFDEGFPQLPQPAPAPSLQSPLLPPQTSIVSMHISTTCNEQTTIEMIYLADHSSTFLIICSLLDFLILLMHLT